MNARDTRVASTVGSKYRITRFMAEGGMGAVYEAQHLFVKRRFAIKFLRQELARRRDVIARFKHEAQAAGALEHENIAAVIDFGVAGDGTPYLVMEYLEGLDLGALLSATGPLPAARASDLVAQAALGAHAAHAAGVVHRDLKPQNLFVCRRTDGTDLLKLLDFGIAKLQAADVREAVTRTGTVLGTPAYMSPEQARGETSLDARTDVYSLGVILYELLSGRLPHPGDSHNAVIHHIATESALPLGVGEGEVPPELANLVATALSRDAEARPASAAALAEQLRPFAQRRTWAPSERPPGRGEEAGYQSTLLASVSIPEAAPTPGRSGPAQGREGSKRWVALFALVGAVGVGVFAATQRSQRTASEPERAAEPPRRPAPAPSTPEPPTARTTEEMPIPIRASAASSETAAVREFAGPRPVRAPERPPGQASVAPARARPPPRAPQSDTAASFDDRNPYK